MKKISLQWRLTIITTLLIAIICGCLTIFIYKNGVYYIDSLQNTVDAKSEIIQIKSISVFRMKTGIISQRIFQSRCITTKQTTKEIALYFQHCSPFLGVFLHFSLAVMH